MPSPLTRSFNPPPGSPAPERLPAQAGADRYADDTANARPARAQVAIDAVRKRVSPASYWREQAQAAHATLRRAAPAQSGEAAVQARLAYLELSKAEDSPQQQLRCARLALEIDRSNGNGTVDPDIASRNLELLFLQATGTPWSPDWNGTRFNCSPERFDPAAFLQYIDVLHQPAARPLERMRSSDMLLAQPTDIREKLRRLYGPAAPQVAATLCAHAQAKASAMEKLFEAASGQGREQRRASAATAAIDAYIDLARASAADPGREAAALLRAIDIHETAHGRGAPDERLAGIATRVAEIFYVKAMGPWATRGSSVEAFKPQPFLRYLEMMNRRAAFTGVAPSTPLQHALLQYRAAEREKVITTLHMHVLEQALAVHFHRPLLELIVGMGMEPLAPEPTDHPPRRRNQ